MSSDDGTTTTRSIEAAIEVLHRDQAKLRDRVRRKLVEVIGETLPPPMLPSAPRLARPSNSVHLMRDSVAPTALPGWVGTSQAARAHMELQRALLALLVERRGLPIPARPDVLLHLALEHYPDVAPFASSLAPANAERALFELSRHAPQAVHLERGELVHLDQRALSDFRVRLMGPAAASRIAASGAPPGVGAPATAPAGATSGASNAGKKRAASSAHDEELAEVLDLVDKKSIKQQEKQEEQNELLELLAKPSARTQMETERFRTVGGSKLHEFCKHGTKEDCARLSGTGRPCEHVHFRRIVRPHTDVSLGDCSYLDTCRHMDKCKFVHYEIDAADVARMRDRAHGRTWPEARGKGVDAMAEGGAADLYARHYGSQFINCDIRTFPMGALGKFAIVMADPPWDIHMELPYGTMSDEEMRRMDVGALQEHGVLFLWVTGRAMELGRECMELWGYRFVQELLWVKTNQLQRVIRTGRTGHWINHSKEHCLIGLKGEPALNWNIDCDVVCAEVRETSRKPDEMYDLLERLAPGTRKLELFGRPHNVHKGWTTLGNQLSKTVLTEPWLREHLLKEGIFNEDDLSPLPEPPKDPIVPPWGGHDPPTSLDYSRH